MTALSADRPSIDPRQERTSLVMHHLLKAWRIPANAQETVTQYLTEFEMLQSGNNPDGIGAFDD